jgi:hypothetical protein
VCPTASPVAWAVQVARALTGVVGTYTVAVYMCDGTIYMVAGFGDFVTKASIAQTEALGSVPDRASRESPSPTARPPFTARRLSTSSAPRGHGATLQSAGATRLARCRSLDFVGGTTSQTDCFGWSESAMSGNVAATTAKSEEDLSAQQPAPAPAPAREEEEDSS